MQDGPYRDRATTALDRYICERCYQRQRGTGMCPEHPDEPLLDLADPEVRLLFERNEGQELRTRGRAIGVVVGVVTYVLALLGVEVLQLQFDVIYLGVFALAFMAGTHATAIASEALPAARQLGLDHDEILALQAARAQDADLALSGPHGIRAERARPARVLGSVA